MNPTELVYKIANKANNLFNKVLLDDVIKTAGVSRKFLPDPKNLTNNEITDIIKVIKSLENR